MPGPRSPSLAEVLSVALDERAALVRVCVPGVVQRFNRTTQTAQVRAVVLKADGSEPPPLPYVPVVYTGVYWDIQPGEAGLVVVADEDWRTWWRTGESSEPETVASHELSSAFFLPGLRAYPDVRTLPVGAAVLEKPTALGSVRLGDQAATKAVLHEDLLGDLSTFLGVLTTWGGTAHANWAAAAVSWAATVAPTIVVLQAGIAGGSYESPTVKVED